MRKILRLIIVTIVRALYLTVGLFIYYMERMANWFIGYHKKTIYIRKGRCRKCGKCCNLLAIQYPNFFNRSEWLIRQTIKWHEFRFGFTYLGRENNYFLYKCNLVRPDGTCSIYRFRPRICREYPRLKLFERPYAHLDCGYYFVRRDGKPTFDEALHKASDKLDVECILCADDPKSKIEDQKEKNNN